MPRIASAQGDPLGPEFRVNTFTSNDQAYSSVAAGGSGFVVVWESLIGGTEGFAVSGQRYDSGGAPLGTEFRVNTYVTSAQRIPAVGANAAGNFVVVWESAGQDGSSWGVFGQRFAASGTPVGPEFRVNASVVGDQLSPDVAVDTSGGFLVAWQSGIPGPGVTFDVFAQRYDSSGTPAGPEFRVNAYTTGTHTGPSVAADASGNYVIAWSGGYGEILCARYAASGAPLGPQFRVNTYTTYSQISSAVATDPWGNFVVVWASQYQEGFVARYDVFGQRYSSSGAPLGPEFRVNTFTTGYQGRPALGFDAAGNFVVVWSDWVQDGGMGVFGQRYSADGTPSGPEFRVNATFSGDQRAPSLAADASGNFLVTWHDFGVTSGDVFGQRFGGIFPVELTHFRVE
jgi:hypothetical protein